MSPSPLTVAVIVGSTREGRFADVVVDWFLREARTRTDMVFDLVDLAVVGLPAALPRRRSAEASAAVATMLDDLAWWGTALRAARTATAPTAAVGTTV